LAAPKGREFSIYYILVSHFGTLQQNITIVAVVVQSEEMVSIINKHLSAIKNLNPAE